MRPNIDWQGIGISSRAMRKHIAHLVQTHRAASSLAPFLEQGAPHTIFICEGLAIVATRNAGANLRHLYQTVPQPIRIDPQVFSWC